MRTRLILFSLTLLIAAVWVPVSAQVDVSAGKKLIETYQWHKANQYFSDLVSKNPADATLKFYLAETWLGLGKTDSAEANYNKSLVLNSGLSFSQAGIGRISLVNGDTLKAKEAFNKAIKMEKKNGDLYAYIAEACITANQPKLAEQFIARGKEITMKNGKIHMADGDLWRLKGNSSGVSNAAGEAANAYERAVYYDKNLPLAEVKLGIIFTESRNYDVAVTDFNKALELDPQYPLAFKGLGDMYYRWSKYKEASDYYKKYIAVSEITMEDTYRYAYILFYNKEYTECTKILDELLATDQKNPVLLRLKSYISYELGMDEKGKVSDPQSVKSALNYIDQFFAAQDKKKYLSSDFEYLAKIQMANGMDSIAPVNYIKAFSMDSTKFSLLDDAANAYYKGNRYDSAASVYRQILKVSQDNPAMNYFKLGQMYYYAATKKDTAKTDTLVKLGKLVLADSAFKKVSELIPTSYLGSLWMARSECQISLIDTKQDGLANPSYDKLIQLSISDPAKRKKELIEAYYYFGSYYYVQAYMAKTKKKGLAEFKEAQDKSLDFWNKMLELSPNDPKATEGIKAVNELNKIKG